MNKYLPNGIAPPDRLIVALDFNTAGEADLLVEKLGEAVGFYKVGWQLFLGTGWPFVKSLLERGKKVFLDLKIGDTENTVRAALANMQNEFAGNLELFTLQGNGPTVDAAKSGRAGNAKPYLLMVTALSSMGDADAREVYTTGDDRAGVSGIVRLRAQQALEAGCEGLIASGESVREVREAFKDHEFLIVTPGIRPAGADQDDHKRSLTPYAAMMYGSDYLVVGRPVTRSGDPLESAESIVSDIGRALEDRESGFKA